ncbi:peptidylprolyl isomerase [Bradyrhizobium sp. RT10b]|uniref:peptidylprolyl isomerase n=1 Tax=Bradyrhizobium sp. RT10b TaxID=3156331 RepID=UPI0033955A80
MIARLVREPLLQFLALGGVLFALYSLVGERGTEETEKIVVSASRVANLADGFARTWRRPPSPEELQGLIDNYVRDEVFYRAGRAAGLDRDDVIIRRRVRQKMEFLAEEISVPEPTDEQLAAYLASDPERFRNQDRLTFRQLFLSSSRRAGTIERDVKQVAAALSGAGAEVDATELGDPFLLGEEFRSMSQPDVARTFGDSFAKQVFAAERGRWQGPIESSFGQHFVFVGQRTKGSVPALDAIRPEVARQWADARRIEAEQKLYRSLRARYEITVEAASPRTTAGR